MKTRTLNGAFLRCLEQQKEKISIVVHMSILKVWKQER